MALLHSRQNTFPLSGYSLACGGLPACTRRLSSIFFCTLSHVSRSMIDGTAFSIRMVLIEKECEFRVPSGRRSLLPYTIFPIYFSFFNRSCRLFVPKHPPRFVRFPESFSHFIISRYDFPSAYCRNISRTVSASSSLMTRRSSFTSYPSGGFPPVCLPCSAM